MFAVNPSLPCTHKKNSLEEKPCHTQHQCLLFSKDGPVARRLGERVCGFVGRFGGRLNHIVFVIVNVIQLPGLVERHGSAESPPHERVALRHERDQRHGDQCREGDDEEAVLDVGIQRVRRGTGQDGRNYRPHVPPQDVGRHDGVEVIRPEGRQSQCREARPDERRRDPLHHLGEVNEMMISVPLPDEHDRRRRHRRQYRRDAKEQPTVERRLVDDVPRESLDDEGRESHEGQGGAHGPLVPSQLDEVDPLEDVESIAQLAQREGDEGEGHLGGQAA
mmetsp:Transcript_28011/g.82361  ORF Transcript_28011/g.82361 Transcript_28011/m.82361 type:complete len:277 (-) Transcript_28011:378-1208(-)